MFNASWRRFSVGWVGQRQQWVRDSGERMEKLRCRTAFCSFACSWYVAANWFDRAVADLVSWDKIWIRNANIRLYSKRGWSFRLSLTECFRIAARRLRAPNNLLRLVKRGAGLKIGQGIRRPADSPKREKRHGAKWKSLGTKGGGPKAEPNRSSAFRG
jgi:hypothetical protein